MAIPSRRKFELNELRWWANWAHLRWLDKNAYMLTSDEFPEAFFNRGGMVTCRSAPSEIRKVEGGFRGLGLAPVIMVYDTCSSVMTRLVRTGYRKTDTMTVMLSTRNRPSAEEGAGRIQSVSSAHEWSKAYLLSFYGEVGLMPMVEKIVSSLQEADRATLLEARIGGDVAGVLAIYRTPGLAGAYCVGTVSRFRKRGVAGKLLGSAKEIASSEGRSLVLQTLGSDRAERFYSERGFARLYRKNLMEKKS